ncbi:MAG: dicarboxylate/amino acid:cation symporter [Pseudomonadota bacterium]|nr:cation:dicarboxylase symporter family transporter [Sphingomonas sp.]MDQ3477539.1 dicarboxylate/amino acid:cation symporter [Pseudomonadota bacterium]
MSEPAKAASPAIRAPNAWLVLAALVVGLLLGIAARSMAGGAPDSVLAVATTVGSLWLDALKMTVIPLVVALLITGVAQNAEAARAGRVAGRTVLWIVIICTVSAILGMLLMQLLVGAFPLSGGAASALQSAIVGVAPTATNAPVAGAADIFGGIIPDNVVAAASNGEILPLVVFSLLFALALSQIAAARRANLIGFFAAVADVLLVIIGWVLWLAPIGILALAFVLGSSAGDAAFAALGHYILLVSIVGVAVTLLAYPLAVFRGGIPFTTFARGMLPPQSVAVSTRSSLASLPAMLASARQLGVREEVADVALPISVALFRATGPAMNVAVAVYVAHLLGLDPTTGQIIAATAVGAVMSYAAISLPGEVSFISSIAPVAMALGAPIEPLALLVAVEMVPDVVRTLGNVTFDVAVTTVVDRETAEDSAAQRPAMARTRSE